jgi:tetratricopeptide (TPR) repeat protein
VYGYIKDYDLARGYYQRALDMDPHNTIAKSGLRLLNSIQTNTQQANNNLQLR